MHERITGKGTQSRQDGRVPSRQAGESGQKCVDNFNCCAQSTGHLAALIGALSGIRLHRPTRLQLPAMTKPLQRSLFAGAAGNQESYDLLEDR